MSLLPTFHSADEFWPACVPPLHRVSLRRLAESIAAGLAWFVAWRLERKAIEKLNALDDRLLRDIGVERGDIRRVATRARRTMSARARRKPGLSRR